jgi:hypothetical protein
MQQIPEKAMRRTFAIVLGGAVTIAASLPAQAQPVEKAVVARITALMN